MRAARPTRLTRLWLRAVSLLVPAEHRGDWLGEWHGELGSRKASISDAWGALPDAWYLRTEGWTMGAMWRDVRTAVRALRRKPGFTVVAGLTLAIGIGANTAIYSVVDAVLINPLPYPESEEMVSYNHDAPGLGVNVPVIPHSEAMYLHYAEHARTIDALTVFTQDNVNLISDGEPRQVAALQVTQRYFDVVGVHPILGRGFAEGEDRPGAEPVAVLAYSLWEQSFGRDPSVVGRLVEMDGVQRRILGVMPAGLEVTDEELWIPLTIDPTDADAGSFAFVGVARLADGATIEQANVEMQDLLLRFAAERPDDLSASMLEQTGLTADVKPLREVFVGDIRPVLWVLLGTVGFVLLIACANVANLFLVRAEARQREVALRSAMGASRLDLVRQYLTESVVLALAAGVVGIGLAAAGVRGLLAIAPAELPSALAIGIDGSVLAYALAISAATGVLFGLFPALGQGVGDVSSHLREGGRAATAGRERHRVRSGLVVTQVALALVLLVGSGLMFRSFIALRQVDLGFEPASVLTFRYALPSAEYPDTDGVLTFHRELQQRLAELPGVSEVGAISGLPLTGAKSATPMEPADRPFAEGELAPLVEQVRVTPGYFAAMEIPVLEGRTLEWTDQADGYRGVVVSQTLAQAFWPNQSALGRSIRRQDGEYAWEVVGVVGDVRFDGVEEEPLSMIYLPASAGDADAPTPMRSMDVVLRVQGDPLTLVQPARGALAAVDARLPMINPRTVADIVEQALAATSFGVVLLGIAAGIALLLGTVGIYGVVSYIVGRRTQEIGIRLALGAPTRVVLRKVLREGMSLTGIGVAVGSVAAWFGTRALTSILYGVSPTDPVTFVGTAGLLVVVALLATWVPARRAARVDPAVALKAD